MYILKDNELTSLVEIKKSKFYTFIYKVNSKQQVKDILNDIKLNNKSARHILYCYLLEDNLMEASENKEPVNSMHKVLEILVKKDIKNILCVCVRYYGGILLGASNLDKTYTSCIFDLVNQDNIELNIDYLTYEIELKSNYFNIVNELILKNNGTILSKMFNGSSCVIEIKIPSLPSSINKYTNNIKLIK